MTDLFIAIPLLLGLLEGTSLRENVTYIEELLFKQVSELGYTLELCSIFQGQRRPAIQSLILHVQQNIFCWLPFALVELK